MSPLSDKKSPRPARNDADLLRRYMAAMEELTFYKTIVSGLDAIILVMDIDQLRLRWANENYSERLGYAPPDGRQLDESRFLSLFHPDDHDYLSRLREYLTGNPTKTYTAFYRFRHARGHFLWMFSSTRVFRMDPEEGVFEILAIGIDFTSPLPYHKNIKQFAQDKLQGINYKDIQKITPREQEVLQLFANGYHTKEIAERLHISFHTVNNHRKNMLKKLQLKNLSSLVNFAVENGLD